MKHEVSSMFDGPAKSAQTANSNGFDSHKIRNSCSLGVPVKGHSVVYFVGIGKHIKIGVSSNFKSRLQSFRSSALAVDVLLLVDGDRALEQRLHGLLAEARVAREIFERDWRVTGFIDHVAFAGLDRGLQFLEETTPRRRAEVREEARVRRVAEQRQTKAEKDAYFASLVAERRQRLGW